jgi:hypothetical protein
MATVLSRILSPAPLLYLFVVITQFAYGAYLGAHFEFPAAATLLFTVGVLWGGWLVVANGPPQTRHAFRLRSRILSLSRMANRNALLSHQDARR